MKNTLQSFVLLFILVGAIIACDSNRVFEKNMSFDNKMWHLDTVPSFEFTIKDKTIPYNLYFNVRNSVSYPYRNLYITYSLEDSLGNSLAEDLVNYELFTRKTGKPLGESGIGDIYDHQFLILENYQFDRSGNYRISFQHYMRKDSLNDVLAIGSRIEKATTQ